MSYNREENFARIGIWIVAIGSIISAIYYYSISKFGYTTLFWIIFAVAMIIFSINMETVNKNVDEK
jgi:hypothetical protein